MNPESFHGAGVGKAANKVVLVIEDDPIAERLMVRAFGKWSPHNEIAVARDGVEALEYLLGAGCDGRRAPALVLLDLKLPRVDGLEVLRRIRAHERTQLLPVVITSCHCLRESASRRAPAVSTRCHRGEKPPFRSSRSMSLVSVSESSTNKTSSGTPIARHNLTGLATRAYPESSEIGEGKPLDCSEHP